MTTVTVGQDTELYVKGPDGKVLGTIRVVGKELRFKPVMCHDEMVMTRTDYGEKIGG